MTKGRKKKPSAKGKLGNKSKTPKVNGGNKRNAMVLPKTVSLKADYRRLLFDPCSATLVHPPYLGLEAGYLIRTRDVFVPFIANQTQLGSKVNDYVVQWSPGNLGPSGATNLGLFVGGATPGGAMSGTTGSYISGNRAVSSLQSNFINATGTSVGTYRVVACCMKWIPTGPVLDRQGVVAPIYSPTPLFAAANPPLFADIEQACPEPKANGSESHEIVWIPNNKDQEYGILDAGVLEAGFGTLTLGLGGIDGTFVNAGYAGYLYAAIANGRVECTTVWQWTARGVANGLTQTLTSPPKHSVNDVLADVVDIGHAIYTGAGKAEHFVGNAAHLLARIL